MPQKKDSELVESYPKWEPSEAQKARLQFVMNEYEDMRNKQNMRYPQFNDRTLREFIDDNEKRMNAYVTDKASQGKEDWQSNFATRAYANKAKALLAATARELPDFKIKAVDTEDKFNYKGADYTRKLVQYSFQDSDPEEEFFFHAWSCVIRGTVLVYEGFERHSFTKKRIKSYDIATGDIEEEVQEVISEGEPVSFEISLMDLMIKDWYTRDIQKQPAIIWKTYYATRQEFETVWGKYPNAHLVPDSGDIDKHDADTFFKSIWMQDVPDDRGVLVMRYMNKYNDEYHVSANGVELYDNAMPWVDIRRAGMGKKAYPIAKSMYEPFAESGFFYGNSLPNSAMGEGDVLNTLYNMALDKQYRSMVPPILVGQINQDMLDLEDDVVAGDTIINVEDVNQVEQMNIRGVTDSDMSMIGLVSQGLDMTTLDPQQQGVAQKYVTARAAVAADERARQLKGLFFMFLESLWTQRIRLRIPSILLSYSQPRLAKIITEEGAEELVERYRTFNIENSELANGEKGTLAVQFVPKEVLQNPEKKAELELAIENAESDSKEEGDERLEMVILPYGFLDNLSYNVAVMSDTLWQASKALNMAVAMEKIQVIREAFPQYFEQNKEVLFRDLVKAWNDDPTKYNLPPEGQEQPTDEEGMTGGPGQGGSGMEQMGLGSVGSEGGGGGPGGIQDVMGG